MATFLSLLSSGILTLMWIRFRLFTQKRIRIWLTKTSDADPDSVSHFHADPDAEPDPACHFDAEPDPSFHTFLACHLQIDLI